MAGPNVGFGDTRKFQHIAEIDTSEIAPTDQSPIERPKAIVTPTHSIKTRATRVKSVRTAKIVPATDPARK